MEDHFHLGLPREPVGSAGQGWWSKRLRGERSSTLERSLRKAEQCAVFEGLGKREVNIRTIKLNAY